MANATAVTHLNYIYMYMVPTLQSNRINILQATWGCCSSTSVFCRRASSTGENWLPNRCWKGHLGTHFFWFRKKSLNKTSVVLLLWWIKWLLKVNAAIQVTILFFQLKKGCSGSSPWNQIKSAEKCWKLWWFWWTLNFESTPHLNEWLWEAAVTKPVKLVFAHPVPKQLWACFCRPTVCIIFVLGLTLLIW